MTLFAEFLAKLALAWAFIANTWWIWLPPGLFLGGKAVYKYFLKVRYFANLEWVLLEVRIPRDIPKTPEAMEQLYGGLQTMFWDFDPLEIWWEGLHHDYIVFEMVSLGGEIHFYIRVPVHFRNVVESHLYAQYPEAEISTAEDYTKMMPPRVPDAEWDIFGIEFRLGKEDAYPVRTYRDFVSMAPAQEEYQKVDPFSSMAELFAKIRPGEFMAYHLLFQPAQTDKWKKEGEELIEKLLGRKPAAAKGPLSGLGKEMVEAIMGTAPTAEQKKEESRFIIPPENVNEQIKAITRNIMKPGFETVIRFCYVARRDMFHLSHLSAFIGALKQYNTLTLNRFVLSTTAMATNVGWWLPGPLKRWRKRLKKELFYRFFKARKRFTDTVILKSKIIILNSEELATIFHFPGLSTKAPLMPRLPGRTSEPPSSLPV